MEQPVRDEFSDDESSCEEGGEPSPDDSDVLDMIEVPQHDEKEYPKRPKKRKKPKKRKPLKIPKKAKPRKAKVKPKLKRARIQKKHKSRKTSLRNIPPPPPPIPAELLLLFLHGGESAAQDLPIFNRSVRSPLTKTKSGSPPFISYIFIRTWVCPYKNCIHFGISPKFGIPPC